jgi:hypothetical protein
MKSNTKIPSKVKKPKLTPLPKLLEKVQKLVNQYVRIRDEGKPCISCGSNAANQAGHYIPVNKSSFLRFDERNIHLQCAGCNCWGHGNQVSYRIELRKKLGDFELEKLERDYIENRVHKWTRGDLENLISFYSDKLKQLKNAA